MDDRVKAELWTAYQAGYDRAVAEIVKWLRKDTPEPSTLSNPGHGIVAACSLDFADAIERGGHNKGNANA